MLVRRVRACVEAVRCRVLRGLLVLLRRAYHFTLCFFRAQAWHELAQYADDNENQSYPEEKADLRGRLLHLNEFRIPHNRQTNDHVHPSGKLGLSHAPFLENALFKGFSLLEGRKVQINLHLLQVHQDFRHLGEVDVNHWLLSWDLGKLQTRLLKL